MCLHSNRRRMRHKGITRGQLSFGCVAESMGKAGVFLRAILAPASECALPFLSVNRAGFRPVARLTGRASFRSALRAARTGIERYFQFYNRQSLDYRTASAIWMPQVF